MKKLLLFSVILATMPLIAQTEVNTFFPETSEGVTYCLPDTRIEITVSAACITYIPGEFHRYAEKFLRVDNAIEDAATNWVINGITVTTNGKPNPEKRYTIKLNNSTAGYVTLCESGIIKGINIKEGLREEQVNKTPQAKGGNRHIDATQYMTEEMIQATSTAKLAELTAREIYTIRESKLDITRGLTDIIPQDGLAMQLTLDELNKQEKALTELFTGRTDTTYFSRTYTIEPSIGYDIEKAILFRFSRKLGFVEKDDLAGEPVYYNLKDMKTVYIPAPEELEKKKTVKKEGVCYNIPGKAEFSVYTRSKKLYNAEMSIAQFGVTEILSKDLFNKKANTRVLFDTATGGIINIEK